VVEDRPFPFSATTGLRGRLVDAVRQPAERQRLQPDPSRAGEVGEEQALTTEERRLDAAHELDVVANTGLQRYEAPGVDPKRLARFQVHQVDRAAGMEEREPVALEPLHDEPSPPNNPTPIFF